MTWNRKIILEDGGEFPGIGFGARRDVVCELVFNTSMVGYQEILSDPSYTDQAVVMSYPLIGNYGITNEDFESRMVSPAALVVRDVNDSPSNFRSVSTLSDFLEDHKVPGLYGVDTRRLVRSIREKGSMRGLVTDFATPVREGLHILEETPVPHDAVRRCSCIRKWYNRTSNPRYHVAVLDCGLKTNIVGMLNRNRCNVTVVPYDTPMEEILALSPDALLVSNGPGDPADVPEVVQTLKGLHGQIPLFGICLGHQLLALSYGAKTYKLKFGHRGGNHPVKDLETGKIQVTSQNHSYAVEEKSLEGTGLVVTHQNLLDGTIEGLCQEKDQVYTVQFHPEGAPGPQEGAALFGTFLSHLNRRDRHADPFWIHTSVLGGADNAKTNGS